MPLCYQAQQPLIEFRYDERDGPPSGNVFEYSNWVGVAGGDSGTTTSGSEAMGQAFSAQPSVLDYRGTDEAGDDEIPLSDSPSSRVANRNR